MLIWLYISYLLLFAYVGLILFYFVGWLSIKPFRSINMGPPITHFSILIPARNESETINKCLDSLVKQNYRTDFFEIIILNDHSEDKTAELVHEFIKKHAASNIKLINLKEHIAEGAKKEAVTFGVAEAANQYIILTDSDCTRGINWLSSIDAFIQKNETKMIYAPVLFEARNVFEKIQALEFSGLVGIGASAIQLKNPNMCSAANLVFEKGVFTEVGGYENNHNLASGDDEFLLHKVFKRYPDQVYFLKNFEAIVKTSPNASVEQLTQQRRRWVSKSTKYEDRYITAILVGAYFFNFSIFFNLLSGFYYSQLLDIGLNQLLIKTGIEGVFLFTVLRFFKQSYLILFLPLAEPFHILYVLIIGIWANISGYKWKDRKLN